MVPRDAAFVSSSLRLREQYDAIVGSNAFKAILELPAVRRALDSIDEQRATPGSPLSTFDTFMQLPENAATVELLADMVATDTFLYGDASCVEFIRFVRVVMEAQQRASLGGGEVVVEQDVVVDEDGDEMELDSVMAGGFEQRRQAKAILAAIATHLDLLVLPDLVWGFRTTKPGIARDQMKRIEVLATLVTQGNPQLANLVARRAVAGGEVVTLTLDGAQVPWDDVMREVKAAIGDDQRIGKVIERLRGLDLVLSIGLVGDWVIVSIGDSSDHLDSLAVAGSDRQGLLTLPAFAPLKAHGGERLTSIGYLSQPMCEALNSSRSDMQTLLTAIDQLGDSVTPEAQRDIRSLAEKAVEEWTRRLPVVGPMMGYAFLTDQGYEGYSWTWMKNQPLDGAKRLDLLGHVGGAPLLAFVSRLKQDASGFTTAVDLMHRAWGLVQTHARPELTDEDRERFDAFADNIAPLGERLVGVLRDKFGPAVGDGQVGFVLDAKNRTKRVQKQLPASSDPLPLVEPAFVIGINDPKLFREGLSDLFVLGDDLTDALRRMNPESIPEGYRIPEPERSKVEGGAVFTWPLPHSGLDEQLRPTIAVGDHAAVLAMTPKQAGRMLLDSRLETGAQHASFDEPHAAVAVVDCAGMLEAIEPWVTYFTRYGCVQEREGDVDPGRELVGDDETPQAREVLAHVKVVLDAMRSLRVFVAETSSREDSIITHWHTVVRDRPVK